MIQPLITRKFGLEVSSVSLKGKNQYRLYFSDGTGLAVGLTGDKVSGIMPLNYGTAVRCITTDTLSSGTEVTYFGSDDGYVYRDNVGTSFDGQTIEAWIRPVFNHSKSPLVRKRYRRAVFEVSAEASQVAALGMTLDTVRLTYWLRFKSQAIKYPVAAIGISSHGILSTSAT